MNIESAARAIELELGEPLPELCQALGEACPGAGQPRQSKLP